jgi:DNA (cytosine-5)-methyltransferase 1
MKHLGLFEGIGGFSLAARWAGWETVAWCEWNEFCQKVLKHHFPKAQGHGDITKTDFKQYANKIDIITGGFPCQPYSMAGKRKGKDDERHLWPEMLRAVREIRPTYVVGENVFGLINWNGGLVFNEVQADLEAEGYEVWAYVLPACAVNAPHRRDRVWFVAYSKSARKYGKYGNNTGTKKPNRNGNDEFNGYCTKNASNTDSNGCIGSNSQHEINTSEGREYAQRDIEQVFVDTKCIGWDEVNNDNGHFKKTQQNKCREQQFSRTNSSQGGWRQFPSQSPICSGDDGLPTQLDGITFSKWRAESIKAYGNAIVPQVAYEIFKAINTHAT